MKEINMDPEPMPRWNRAFICFKRSVVLPINSRGLTANEADELAGQSAICASHKNEWPECGEYQAIPGGLGHGRY